MRDSIPGCLVVLLILAIIVAWGCLVAYALSHQPPDPKPCTGHRGVVTTFFTPGNGLTTSDRVVYRCSDGFYDVRAR